MAQLRAATPHASGWHAESGAPGRPVRSAEVFPAGGQRPALAAGVSWVEALQAAVDGFPVVAAARAGLARQESLVQVARAEFLPRVQSEITTGQQGEFGTGQVATLGLSQLLYDFGKAGSALERERAGVRVEEAAVLAAVDDVLVETAHALIDVHRYARVLEVYAEQSQALARVHEITRLRAQAGATSRSDPLQAQARIEALLGRVIAARSQLRVARQRLAMLTGLDADADVHAPPEMVLVRAVNDVHVEQLPRVRMAYEARNQAQAGLRNARAQRYPTIALEANANRRMGQAGSRYEQIYGRSTYSTAFVTMRSSLYQGGAVSAQARASASALDAADAQLAAERLMAQEAIARHREEVMGYAQQMDSARARFESMRETRRLYWDQYLSLGTRTALDLLNAEQEVGQSREDVENIQSDLWRAQVDHLAAAGALRDAFRIRVGVGQERPER